MIKNIFDLRINEIPGFEYLEIISHASPKKKYFLNVLFTHIFISMFIPQGSIPEMRLLNVEEGGGRLGDDI